VTEEESPYLGKHKRRLKQPVKPKLSNSINNPVTQKNNSQEFTLKQIKGMENSLNSWSNEDSEISKVYTPNNLAAIKH